MAKTKHDPRLSKTVTVLGEAVTTALAGDVAKSKALTKQARAVMAQITAETKAEMKAARKAARKAATTPRTPPKRLTNEAIEKLTPRAKVFTVRDGLVPQLELRIRAHPKKPDGTKVWSLRFNYDGQPKRLPLGKLPGMDIAKARIAARKELHKLDNRIDPAKERKDKKAAKANTVAALVTDYVAYQQERKRSWKQDRRQLVHVTQAWGKRAVSAITAEDVSAYLQKLVKRGAKTSANRHRATLHAMFKYAIKGRQPKVITHNPVSDVEAPSPTFKKRKKLFGTPAHEKGYSAAEVVAIWKNTETCDPQTRCQIRMQLLCACRPGEVIDVPWQELDIESGWWSLPGERTKAGVARRIYLTQTVIDELARVPVVDDADYVFEGFRARKAVATANTAVFKTIARRAKPRHRLRNAATDQLTEAGVPLPHVSMVLGHSIDGVADVTLDYSAQQWDPFIRQALETLERRVLGLVDAAGATTAAKVVSIGRRRHART